MHTSHAEPGTARRIAPTFPRTVAPTVEEELRLTRERLERMRIAHRSEELRRIDAQIQNAWLTREVMRLSGTVDSIISG